MEYKNLAIKLAQQAGDIIKENFSFGMKKEYKAEDSSPVTKTDKEVNSLVIEAVKKYFPDHDVVGEEESSKSNNSDYKWYCDPVDGTMTFSHGIPICTFSLGLVYKGKPIMGVVYEPFMDNMYYAESGKGAFLNNKPITVDKNKEVVGKVVGLEHWNATKFNFSKIYGALEDERVKTLKFSSFIYKSVLVANGELIGTIFPHTTPHDLAAIHVIVEEAGGKVTDLYGKEINYNQEINGYLGTNGLSHDYLLQKIKENVKL